jgi:hypothetical protein
MKTRIWPLLITIVSCLFVIELCLTAVFWFSTGQLIWLRSAKEQSEVVPVAPATRMILNPYLGYTFRPGFSRETFDDWRVLGYDSRPAWLSWRANNYGFLSPHDYPTARVAGKDFIVGIFGSSVAQGLTSYGGPTIERYLLSNPALQNRNIVILDFCIGGYKQPQQLLTLAYFVALGQHFDLIINMDGMTGAYIGWENVAHYQVDPIMPTARFIFGLQNFLSAGAEEATAAQRARVAKMGQMIAHARSGAWYYLLTAIRNSFERKRAETLADTEKAVPSRHYIVRMNEARQREFLQNIDHIAEVWARSSLEMAAIADRIGATYLHILEPNQWIGRKPLSADEKSLMARATDPLQEIVPPAYSALFNRSEKLKTQINFLDATGAFEGHEETIYKDDCCHFYLLGYNLLVENVLGPWLQTFKPVRARSPLETQ